MHEAEDFYRRLIDANKAESVSSAKAQQHYIETKTARYHGYLARTLYMPKLFTSEMAAYIEKNALIMYGILEKVIARYRQSTEYRSLFGFDERLERLILRPRHYDCAIPMARLDIFLNEDDYSFKFCEFNTDGTSAMNEDKELNEAIRVTDTFRRFKTRYNTRTFELFDSWVKEFIHIYSTYDNSTGKKPYVAIVDFFGGDVSREFTNFRNAFQENGLECEICEITSLRYENGALFSPTGHKIDAVYRRAVTVDIMNNYEAVMPFIRAAEDNSVCLIGDFETQIVHNKIVFKILRDPMTTAFLTDDERQFVNEHIPLTVSLTSENVSKYSVLENKEKWVIKPEDSYASRGVFAGVENITASEWENAVTENCGKRYLLQEYCEPYASWNIDLTHDENAGYMKYSNITGIYMYAGKFAGLYSRIARNSIISTQYSEMSLPTVIADKKI